MLEIKTPPIVRSFTGFQPLRETWLGDCYPIHYYDHFDNKSRDFFSYITEIIKNIITKILNRKIQHVTVSNHGQILYQWDIALVQKAHHHAI